MQLGGAANYNLFTKAIDIACAGMLAGGMVKTLADAIVKYRDRELSGNQKTRLAWRYNTMSPYWFDQTLTKFGLTWR